MSNYYSYKGNDIDFAYSMTEHARKRDFSMHTHERYELYCFLEGKGTFKVEGSEYPLEKGDILIMRDTESHYIDVCEDLPYSRIAIHFNPKLFKTIDSDPSLLMPYLNRDRGKLNRYKASEFKNNFHSLIINNLTSEYGNKRLNIISNLLILLSEMNELFLKKNSNDEESTIFKIIAFINQNICENITIDMICKLFFISKAQLYRNFKTATGTTVWNYITIKRLVKARKLMFSGLSPTNVYSQCGFKDYSVFYKAYKKQYGVSPSSQSTTI